MKMELIRNLTEHKITDLSMFLSTKGELLPTLEGRSILVMAVEAGNLDLVKFYVDHGDSISEYYSKYRFNILCSKNGYTDLLRYFKSKRLQIFDRDDEGSSPLHYAAYNGHLETLKFLISLDVEENECFVKDRFGNTALHYAASKDHLEIFKVLLERVDGDHIRNGAGLLAIEIAMEYESREILKYLSK